MKKNLKETHVTDLNQQKHVDKILEGKKLNGEQMNKVYQANQIKGSTAENHVEKFFVSEKYEVLPSKALNNQGLDHVFIKRDNLGNVIELKIVETKFKADGIGRLSDNQMSNEAIRNQLDSLIKFGGVHKDTALLIEQNWSKMKKQVISVNKNGEIFDISDQLKKYKE
jgi:hypothetical protein